MDILVLCAHPDDEVFGLGGTLAKYAREGKKVTTIIFSYGEMAMPWMKPEEVQKVRRAESERAAKILGIQETIFLGLKEGKFGKASTNQRKKVLNALAKNPKKVFTHVPDDPHLDHRAAYKFVRSLLKEADYKGEVYGFDVWNLLSLKQRNTAKLFVDISQTFKQKLAASKVFETQKIQGRWPLVPALMFRAFFFGFQNGCRYAERFRKL